jgi:hypothetical protein
MLETQYVPCPGGSHPETYRMWEALEIGAIPVLVRASALQPIEAALGPGSAVWLGSWSELPGFLLGVQPEETARRARATRAGFGAARRALMLHLARAICLLRQPPPSTGIASSSSSSSLSVTSVIFPRAGAEEEVAAAAWGGGGPPADLGYTCAWEGESDGHEVGIDLGPASGAAISAKNSSGSGGGGGECEVGLYGELSHFLQAVAGRAAAECGARLRRRAAPRPAPGAELEYPARSLVAVDLGATGTGGASSWAGAEQTLEALVRMAARGAAALRGVGVLYLRDERRRAPPAGAAVHAAAAFSYHQLWRPDLEGAVTGGDGTAAEYLLRRPQADTPGPSDRGSGFDSELGAAGAGHVFWLPLGHGDTFHARPVLVTPVEGRPLLWSWAAVDGGGARGGGEVMAALEAHPAWPELRARGRAAERFADSDVLGAAPPGATGAMRTARARRGLLLASQYAPCPGGPEDEPAETHRLWEALEAGAIPILVRAAALKPIEVAIGPDAVVWLGSWAELPLFLLSVRPEETARRARTTRARYLMVRAALSAHLARAVCGLCATADADTAGGGGGGGPAQAAGSSRQ